MIITLLKLFLPWAHRNSSPKIELLTLLLLAAGLCGTAIPAPAQLHGPHAPKPAQVPGAAVAYDTVKILSWNTYLLPGWLSWTQPVRRQKTMAEYFAASDYDLIALQEVFTKRRQGAFIRMLRAVYPYHTRLVGKDCLLKQDAGLLIFSRTPLALETTSIYDTCQGVDCRSNKGAVLIQTEIDKHPLQLVTTHAQAFDGKGRQGVRFAQYEQLYQELLAAYQQEGVWQLVTGDLNTWRHESAYYRKMLRLLDAEDPRAEQLPYAPTYTPENDRIPRGMHGSMSSLDYILSRNQPPGCQVAEVNVVKFREKDGKPPHDLSDHFALEAILLIPSTEQP